MTSSFDKEKLCEEWNTRCHAYYGKYGTCIYKYIVMPVIFILLRVYTLVLSPGWFRDFSLFWCRISERELWTWTCTWKTLAFVSPSLLHPEDVRHSYCLSTERQLAVEVPVWERGFLSISVTSLSLCHPFVSFFLSEQAQPLLFSFISLSPSLLFFLQVWLKCSLL